MINVLLACGHARRIMEEKLNAITHGIGALLAFGGLIFLSVSAALRGNVWHVVSFNIYGASLFLLYPL